MAALDFLTIIYPYAQANAQSIFNRFARKSGTAVVGQFNSWDTIWQEVVNTGIYRKGADIGEFGTTWLDSLVEMNALRPFTPSDIELMGGSQAFVPSLWNILRIRNKSEIWGIPVRADPRVLWYWKDMVEDSGLDPETAFSSFEQFPTTMQKLTRVIPTPWGTNTTDHDSTSIHTLASWVWKAGGDFISEDGKHILFMEPKTLEAIVHYFELYRYMPPNPALHGLEVVNMFTNRQVAATIGGPWVFHKLSPASIPAEVRAKLGFTTIPGPSFAGGTVLVIWQHCRDNEKAIEFARYLVSPEVQAEYPGLVDLVPVREETWKMEPFASDPIYQVLHQALLQGRSLPIVPLWGMIESRLVKTISQVWEDLFTSQNPDIPQIVRRHFGGYARQLSLALDR